MSLMSRREAPTSEDEVLDHLGQAADAYRLQQSNWITTVNGLESSLASAEDSNRELQSVVAQLRGQNGQLAAVAGELEADLEETRSVAAELRLENGELTSQAAALAGEREELSLQLRSLEEEKSSQRAQISALHAAISAAEQRAERQRKRANDLAQAVEELHSALFSGNVYELILRACITISGAGRGMYVTWRGDHEPPRVQAAFGIDGYPEAPPSPFVVELCKKAIEEQETLVCNDPSAFEGLPQPKPSEQFRNCAVAPTVLMRGFDGIVLVADKETGEFDEDDLEALLSVGGHATVALENAQLHRDLQNAYVSTIAVLADAVEAKDPYTHGHCEEASRLARLTAERLGLPDHEKSVICYAALLHDVGKIGVSDGVLHKPGALLPEERELVRAHVRVGHDLIRHVPALASVAEAVLHHHEWFNGEGYPDGLRGEQIPIAARVIAVVDAFGAMTTKRSYKEAYTTEHAREELARFAGSQFDPRIVETFLSMLDDADGMGAPDCGPLPDLPLGRSA